MEEQAHILVIGDPAHPFLKDAAQYFSAAGLRASITPSLSAVKVTVSLENTELPRVDISFEGKSAKALWFYEPVSHGSEGAEGEYIQSEVDALLVASAEYLGGPSINRLLCSSERACRDDSFLTRENLRKAGRVLVKPQRLDFPERTGQMTDNQDIILSHRIGKSVIWMRAQGAQVSSLIEAGDVPVVLKDAEEAVHRTAKEWYRVTSYRVFGSEVMVLNTSTSLEKETLGNFGAIVFKEIAQQITKGGVSYEH